MRYKVYESTVNLRKMIDGRLSKFTPMIVRPAPTKSEN